MKLRKQFQIEEHQKYKVFRNKFLKGMENWCTESIKHYCNKFKDLNSTTPVFMNKWKKRKWSHYGATFLYFTGI